MRAKEGFPQIGHYKPDKQTQTDITLAFPTNFGIYVLPCINNGHRNKTHLCLCRPSLATRTVENDQDRLAVKKGSVYF